jgi:integrase-like protein
LFVLVLLAHDRRRIRHVAVTAHPTAEWTAQQLREAFPWEEAPRYLIHDRDHAFDHLGTTVKAMGMEEVLTAPRSPWQNAYVERFIGSARRECFDHVIVFSEAGLRRLMTLYCAYHERSRTHLSLDKDSPIPRPVTASGMATSWPSRRSVASIIDTNGARPERAFAPLRRHAQRHAPTAVHGPAATSTRQLSAFHSRSRSSRRQLVASFNPPERTSAPVRRRNTPTAHGVQITVGTHGLVDGLTLWQAQYYGCSACRRSAFTDQCSIHRSCDVLF